MSLALVTGGAGFIGSHLVDRLLADGRAVRILDNLDPLAHPTRVVPDHVAEAADVVVGDLRDRDTVDRALDRVDEVFHLGGVVGNGESMVNVRRAVDNNSGGTATLLEAVIARRDAIRRIVVASSMVVYGDGAYDCPMHGRTAAPRRTAAAVAGDRWEPRCLTCDHELEPVAITEDTPLRPTSVYGITKRDQEELVLTLGSAYGFEAVALRYLNVYGPRQALDNPYTGVAAIFAARVLTGRAPLVFEDGRQIRDLVHVSDVARATAAAMEAPDAPGLAINVATGARITVADLARAVAGALGSDLEPEITGRFRTGDIRHCYADTHLARDVLGFSAAVAPAQGLPALAAWVRDQDVEERGDAALADLTARGLVSA